MDRTKINLYQQNLRANYPQEIKDNNKLKDRDRKRKKRSKVIINDNDNNPPESVLHDESVLLPPAACTPNLYDYAHETEPCTASSSSSSVLKSRKITEEEEIKCNDDESVEAPKTYNFFLHNPDTTSSTKLTDQPQLLVTSSITSSNLKQPPAAEVRNVQY